VTGTQHALRFVRFPQKAHADRACSRLDVNRNLGSITRRRSRVTSASAAFRRCAADRELLHFLAVQTHVEEMLLAETTYSSVICAIQKDLDDVIAFDGEVIADGEAASRTKRQILARAAVLPEVLVHRKAFCRRPDRWIADGDATDFLRRRQVALRQHR